MSDNPYTREQLEAMTKKDLSKVNDELELGLDMSARKNILVAQILGEEIPEEEETTPKTKTKVKTAEDKIAAVAQMLEKKPDAVLVPIRQALVRIQHPSMPQEQIQISAIEDFGMKFVESLSEVTRPWKLPADERPKREEQLVNTTPLSSIPKWAHETVYDMVLDGELKLYQNDEDAQAKLRNRNEPERIPILDVAAGSVNMEVVRDEATRGMNPQHRPVIVEPRGRFTEPEQDAAWNVLNSIVDNEPPLPSNMSEVSEDPKTISSAEIHHVQRRIERCLEHPNMFTKKPLDKKTFRTRIFFNQLLECEYRGFTPQRTNAGNKIGGTRPDVLRLLRRIAKQHGFEVVGDYVLHENDQELKPKSVMPTESITGIPHTSIKAPYKLPNEA